MQRHKMRHPYKQADQFDEEFMEDAPLFRQNESPSAPDRQDESDAPSARKTERPAEEEDIRMPDQLLVESVEERCQAEISEARLRAAAEMENFKKRLSREHEEQLRYAAEKVLGDLLPTLDNLDLALQYGSRDDACKDMLQGVAMTRKLLLEAVARHGLNPVGEEGEEFNPAVHEAVGFEARPEWGANAVARILQCGYKLNDRLLRPAKVMVTP